MKRFTCIVIGLLVLFTSIAAFAEEVELTGPVAELLAEERFAGYAPVAADARTLRGKTLDNGAVIMARDGRYVLVMLRRDGDTYRVVDSTATAIYQDGRLPKITFEEYEEEAYYVCFITYTDEETGDREIYTYTDSGETWYASSVEIEGRPSFDIVSSMAVTCFEYINFRQTNYRDGVVTWEGPMERVFTHFGRRLANFEIETFPHSYEEGLAFKHGLPKLAEGEQQNPLPQGVPMALPEGTLLPLYDAPLHGDQARPPFSGSEIDVVGLFGAFALIRYEDDTGDRFAFTPEGLIDGHPEAPELVFANLDATMLEKQPLLDGPAGNETLPLVGTGRKVTYLATYGSDLSFISFDGVFGFVPSDALAVSYGMYDGNEPVEQAVMLADGDLLDDPYRTATPKALAALEAGDQVGFLDNLYGEWAYVELETADGPVHGYVPRDDIENVNPGMGLEGHG